jgi:ATP-dependent 26S proteasome regulatory subunit
MKRGVLLSGQPGNGKTMACRWLAGQCRRHGLLWSTVSAEQYTNACGSRSVPNLFQLKSPGIILFDDFDQALRDRESVHDTDRQSTFLTELDGIRPKVGVVYLFTTNQELNRLDPALCRPGRIDVVIRFPRPDVSLRRQLIQQTWHRDLRTALDVDRVVTETDGLSFAEIEELRTLLVLHFLDTHRWNWAAARRALGHRREEEPLQRPIGFGAVHPTFRSSEAATSARAK